MNICNQKQQLILAKIQQLDNEVWKPVSNSSFRYFVSNKGRVCSLVYGTPHILGQYQNNSGYYRVCLSLNVNQSKRYLVHRLVAETFLENDSPDEKTTVHHKNHNKNDNTVENLEFMSLSDNIKESNEYLKEKRQKNG